jgi:transcriptional regulator GlxA family with amidase domain
MKRRIAIIGYDGVAAINVAGPLEVFSKATRQNNADERTPCYNVSFVASRGSQCLSDTGVIFCESPPSADSKEPFDTIIVPGGSGLRRPDTCAEVARWVTEHADGARRIASICTGIYALASTGLVDGRSVTTHWEHAREVSQRFPRLNVEESALFLKDGRFYSSAGATAGIDLSLALIGEDFGQEVALNIARRLLVYLVRDGGQEQYSEPKQAKFNPDAEEQSVSKGRMNQLVRWVTEHLGDDLKLDRLAKRACLTKNNLWEQFSKTFGVSPALFVKNLRFNEARRRLSRGENAGDVARALGLRDEYFNQEFRRRFGALPYEYQRRFGSLVVAGDPQYSSCLNQPLVPSTETAGDMFTGTPYQRPRIVSFTRCVRGRPAA